MRLVTGKNEKSAVRRQSLDVFSCKYEKLFVSLQYTKITMTQSDRHIAYRELWSTYRSEVAFGVIVAAVVVASTWLSQFIPVPVFDNILTPLFNVCTATIALFGAWIIFRHTEGMRVRRLWGYVLIVWGISDLTYLICYMIAPMRILNMGAMQLTTHELLIGNLLGWMMTLYPTETLRPGWLTWKIVLWQLVPLTVLVVLDYIVPFSLWPLIAVYPYVLLVQVLTHIRAYRLWCEENYSTMDNIDVQWIIRYCIMLFLIGANYVYMCATHGHTRGFTQQWFVVFMLAYSTVQILFRKDPWEGLAGDKQKPKDDTPAEEAAATNEADCKKLEAWMEAEKPYLNPNFKLIDLRAVLPMNRSYISQLINSRYGCSFYQFVSRYRIEEAKRLMLEQPDMKLAEVAIRSGFSSPSVFSTIFSKETGVGPRDWSKSQTEQEG